jgi:hypothetical protein
MNELYLAESAFPRPVGIKDKAASLGADSNRHQQSLS